mmetsp:Transcript_22620/g.46895  ORF Transcript_22620/g.46895 Transcript_22620/m.46895 type:complete len:211 (+) Transcript_22620:1184-1816(+)
MRDGVPDRRSALAVRPRLRRVQRRPQPRGRGRTGGSRRAPAGSACRQAARGGPHRQRPDVDGQRGAGRGPGFAGPRAAGAPGRAARPAGDGGLRREGAAGSGGQLRGERGESSGGAARAAAGDRREPAVDAAVRERSVPSCSTCSGRSAPLEPGPPLRRCRSFGLLGCSVGIADCCFSIKPMPESLRHSSESWTCKLPPGSCTEFAPFCF